MIDRLNTVLGDSGLFVRGGFYPTPDDAVPPLPDGSAAGTVVEEGCFGGADGAMESSIVIRTLVIEGNQVIAQAGGGIVADSVPAEEYAESLDKAGVLLSALNPDWRAEDG